MPVPAADIPVFGKTLRELRVRARLSGAELGAQAGMSQSKVSKIECGHLVPSREDVVALAAALHVSRDVAGHLLSIASEARGSSRESDILVAQRKTNRLHEELTFFRYCVPTGIPAPLQTPAYAEARFARTYGAHGREMDLRLVLRVEQQAKLYDHRKQFRFLISSTSLSTDRGGKLVLLEQLRALLVWIERPNLELRIMPETGYPDWYLPGVFYIAGDRSVFVELAAGHHFVEDQDAVRSHIEIFDGAWKASIRDESVKQKILDVIEELDVASDIRVSGAVPNC